MIDGLREISSRTTNCMETILQRSAAPLYMMMRTSPLVRRFRSFGYACVQFSAQPTSTRGVNASNSSARAGHAPPTARLSAADEALLDELVRPEKLMRVDNLLSQNGFCMRKEARSFCRENDVTLEPMAALTDVEPERVMTGSVKVNPARLRVDGESIPYAGVPLHIALYKPAGAVCTNAVDEGETVYDLIPDTFLMRTQPAPLQAVGRLDRMATGLLILTQHGVLNDRLTSPRRHISKEYIVSLSEPLSQSGSELAIFAAGGLELADGSAAAPCIVQPHKTDCRICKVVLHEGRYHQIRRMFAAVGNAVVGIHRSAIGGLRLSELGLQEGGHVVLKRQHLAALLSEPATGAAGTSNSNSIADDVDEAEDGDAAVKSKRKQPYRRKSRAMKAAS